jgi:hypothetical protein
VRWRIVQFIVLTFPVVWLLALAEGGAGVAGWVAVGLATVLYETVIAWLVLA